MVRRGICAQGSNNVRGMAIKGGKDSAGRRKNGEEDVMLTLKEDGGGGEGKRWGRFPEKDDRKDRKQKGWKGKVADNKTNGQGKVRPTLGDSRRGGKGGRSC